MGILRILIWFNGKFVQNVTEFAKIPMHEYLKKIIIFKKEKEK
jgi:hypothetical protein